MLGNRTVHEHRCCGYDRRGDFVDEAVAFLADGLDLGEQVSYIGAASVESLRAEVAALGERVAVRSLAATYVRADHEVVYAEAAIAAVADGYTGLRVVADATELVLDDVDRDAFARYEHRVDRLIAAGLPFAALCAYDRGRLGSAAVDELACVHPLAVNATTPFAVHAVEGAGFALAGEIDGFFVDELGVALDRVLEAIAVSDVPVACARLDFADHQALAALDAAAGRAGVTFVLAEAPGSVLRLLALLGLERVRTG